MRRYGGVAGNLPARPVRGLDSECPGPKTGQPAAASLPSFAANRATGTAVKGPCANRAGPYHLPKCRGRSPICGANGISDAESPMAVNCKRCGNPVPAEKRECQACGEDNGFPNVRLAQEPAEVAELRVRLHNAEVSTTARHCKQILDQFGTAVLGSKAVIARSLAVVQDLLENDRRTYTNYQRQLSSGARTAEDNDIDRVRTQFESALFPNFHGDILFACLSLNNRGVAAYGDGTAGRFDCTSHFSFSREPPNAVAKVGLAASPTCSTWL